MTEYMDKDRREFHRYPIDFEVEVRNRDQEEIPFCDMATLSNISGAGMRLLTACPELYSRAQTLALRIRLPDTAQTESFMSCEATVRWVEPGISTSGMTLIGLSLSQERHFERHQKENRGCQNFCVNGVGLLPWHSVIELNAKAV